MVRLEGLSQEEVAKKIKEGKQNKVTIKTEKSIGQIIRDNVFTYFNLIFLVLAFLLVAVKSWNNLLFVPVVVVNSLVGIVQEVRSRRILRQMQFLHMSEAIALREGKEVTLPIDQLVEGDLVCFQAGDQIYADGVLLEGELKVDESQLTGEADEVKKGAQDALMSGSFVIAGQGLAQLEKVGNDSYINQLSLEAKQVKSHEESDMVHAVNRIVGIIGLLIIPLGSLLFLRSYISLGDSLKLSVTSTVGALIGMIPEGLYLLMTLALALGAVRLAKEKVLLNSMKGIETLSRVDVLCVDKTGTITEPGMEVTEIRPVKDVHDLEALAQYVGASMDQNDTMDAIREFHKTQVSQPWKALEIQPFTSKKKYGAIAFESGIYVLGAPEFVLREGFSEVAEEIAPATQAGNRVLAFGKYRGEHLRETLEAPVDLVAWIILSNPLRKHAKETFAYFKQQGVTIKVISGDNPATVSAIAQKAGIEGAEDLIDARTVLTEEDLHQAASQYTVFGRVTPEQKKSLVEGLQAKGHKVAMTGDGVNDILALKTADCSIAMESGNDATKKMAQVVLLDSDFGKMPSIVAEGRRVVNNIQRSASLFLIKNIFSILLAISVTLLAFTYPIMPSQMSLISGFTIGIPGFFLALEPNSERIKGRFIETVFKNALPAALTDFILIFSLVLLSSAFGMRSEELSSAAICLMAFVGFTIIYQESQPINHYKRLVLLGNILAFLVSSSILGRFFNMSPLRLQTLVICAIMAVLALILIQVFKKLVGWFFHRKK